MEKNTQITQAEWPIMQILWERDSATASEIVGIITSQKNVAMRTVKTLIRRLVAKEAVGYTVDQKNSRVYHYFALVSKERCTSNRADTLLNVVNGQDMGDILIQFVGGAKLNRKQIENLELLLKRKKDELE